jgi:hypothetical protein
MKLTKILSRISKSSHGVTAIRGITFLSWLAGRAPVDPRIASSKPDIKLPPSYNRYGKGKLSSQAIDALLPLLSSAVTTPK